MTAAANDHGRAPRRWFSLSNPGGVLSRRERFARWLARFSLPPERWHATHRLAAGVALSAAAFALGKQGLHAFGAGVFAPGEVTHIGAEVAELSQRIEAARKTVEKLPALRKATENRGALTRFESPSDIGQWKALSALAADSGMALRSLAPGERAGEGAASARAVRLKAEANFAAVAAFLNGLSTLPSLAVPIDMRIERMDGELAIDATLRVFDVLRSNPHGTHRATESDASVSAEAAPRAADDSTGLFEDPFATSASATIPEADNLRLIGLMHADARGLALIGNEQGVAFYAPGEGLGVERVVSVSSHGVTLAAGARKRRVTFEQEDRP
jgi:hypothetical protein